MQTQAKARDQQNEHEPERKVGRAEKVRKHLHPPFGHAAMGALIAAWLW